jgi:hypothetical protein
MLATRVFRHLAAFALVAVTLSGESLARADAAKILLAHGVGEAKAAARVRAELEALGFSVSEQDVPDGPAALADAARKSGAVAAVRVTPSERGVEVWIVDRVTGKTLLREVVRPASGSHDDAVAVRAVELLRASLLELDVAVPPRGELPPPKAVRAMIPPRKVDPSNVGASGGLPKSPLGDATIGLASTISPGGIDPIWQLHLGLRYRIADYVGIDIAAYVPVPATTLRAHGASADVRAYLFTFGGELSTNHHATVAASIAAGFAFNWLHVDGHDVPPLVGRTVEWTNPTWYVRAGSAWRLSNRVRVRADMLLGATTTQPVLTVGSQDVARWGRPFLTPTLALELGWP